MLPLDKGLSACGVEYVRRLLSSPRTDCYRMKVIYTEQSCANVVSGVVVELHSPFVCANTISRVTVHMFLKTILSIKLYRLLLTEVT